MPGPGAASLCIPIHLSTMFPNGLEEFPSLVTFLSNQVLDQWPSYKINITQQRREQLQTFLSVVCDDSVITVC